MIALIYSGSLVGIDGLIIEVEVDLARGLPSFTTVGLAEGAVKESKDRVRAALKNQGYSFPMERITVNLAPANIRKEGSSFDLPIAIGLLAAQNLIKAETLKETLLVGELSLSGEVKPVKGGLSLAIAAKNKGLKNIILPKENTQEASVVKGINVYAAEYLNDVVNFFLGNKKLEKIEYEENRNETKLKYLPDLSDVKGQEQAKRALTIAAAGAHNILFIGPPGSGKTMLAQRLPSILPKLNFNEAIETTKIYSAVGRLNFHSSLMTERPFRSPHHTISDVGLIGGGRFPKPGEISLAHNGVLFLDELPEFKKNVLEVMRQPLEDGKVSVARAAMSLTFPSQVMLIAAMNPCPCGFLGDPKKNCTCKKDQIQRYRNKISGPLLDRIDLHVEAPPVNFQDLSTLEKGISSQEVRKLVKKARSVQSQRFANTKIHCNAQMNTQQLEAYSPLDESSLKLLKTAVERLNLSARAYSRIIKISRTIADLSEEENITANHIAEAISYRSLDREQ